jgi:DNA-directed RNA polymerase alpha subunit
MPDQTPSSQQEQVDPADDLFLLQFDGLDPRTCDRLMEHGIRTISAARALPRATFLAMWGLGVRSWINLQKVLEEESRDPMRPIQRRVRARQQDPDWREVHRLTEHGVDVVTFNALVREGYDTLDKVRALSHRDFRDIRNLGHLRWERLQEALRRLDDAR